MMKMTLSMLFSLPAIALPVLEFPLTVNAE